MNRDREAELGKRLRETWAAYTKAGEPTEYIFRMVAREALAALSPTTLGGRSGSAQDGLPPARSLPSALTSAGPATGADQ